MEFTALVVSIVSLGLSFYFWSRSFRPIVTAMVKTHAAGGNGFAFNLQILNSGSLPAQNIRLQLNLDDVKLKNSFGNEAGEDKQKEFVTDFNVAAMINMLQNGESTSCSFGHTKGENGGFWKYGATIPITIEYESWMIRLSKWSWVGKLAKMLGKYSESQEIRIIDSESFTGSLWGNVQHKKEICKLMGIARICSQLAKPDESRV